MRKIILLILILALSQVITVNAADGYYITFENDTIYVDFVGAYDSTPNEEDYTWSAIYFNKEGKRTLLSPKVAKEICWTTKIGETIRMVSILNKARYESPPNKSGLRFFATVVIEEKKLSLYIFHNTSFAEMLNGIVNVSKYLFVKENGDMLTADYNFGDKKRIMNFLSNCPNIVKAIKEKKIKSYENILKYYNSECFFDTEVQTP